MNFRRGSQEDELEINFIPLIDVLLVIIIFLVVSTTFSKFSELKINLPTAEAIPQDKDLDKVDIVITSDNQYFINDVQITDNTIAGILEELKNLKSKFNNDLPTVIINADAMSNHQSVINVMEAARLSGLNKVTFATKVN
ncbi:biopolymer transporter ExbD [Methylophilales bacterium MBRSG12]|jgi:biopolymer transport protein ExbD|uniref:Biopolymer transporter ExbD n=1 Tax=Methylophilales bacterium MBRS-H7 TaxID=1623450 RepID=A0A0H4IWW5_9PROT|nr:biopolymer transporter ExbD [Methylophilales bacterium MBRSF5]AKO65461.1 biopolymer transporter ExbD [Methylophilales bacterium MBRS-H7]AKO66781.1 biopolymer transporter ExbD [Methylophilales bacterium MBRSG12]